MQCAQEKHWKYETKVTCKEQLKLITALISSGDNSEINGNIAPVFSSCMAKSFWIHVPLLEVHCSLVLFTATWEQVRFGHDLDIDSPYHHEAAWASGQTDQHPVLSSTHVGNTDKSLHFSVPQFTCLQESRVFIRFLGESGGVRNIQIVLWELLNR